MRVLSAILGATLLLTPAAANGQGFRLNGGVNLSDFFGGDVGSTETKTGLDLGASFPVFRMGAFQLRAEGYYRQKGARDAGGLQQALIAGEDVEIGIDYIEVPVLLRWDLPALGGRLLPYVQGGPAFAWRIDCGVRVDAATGSGEESCDDLQGADLEETLRDYETGLVLGGGFDVPVLSLGAVNIDARYVRGLSRLAEDRDIHNRAFSVMLGYSFGMPSGAAGGPLVR